jgi:hypothetical protein
MKYVPKYLGLFSVEVAALPDPIVPVTVISGVVLWLVAVVAILVAVALDMLMPVLI